ncbi:hypothetical protein HID58_032678 [Brassica napus]|uniref:Calponin-homology (CH) domain-containing protein n=1 Tax=Brassica napus TaxID=3708 RepID=A0ABQ7XCZ4_BRANA|nr:hypothetical protein HID58_090728 [Brassica napus]KAH0909357.1 hypothetical protein HID58_032678 [Brassica napus]
MSSYVGVLVSDPWLQSQFTQVELRNLKSKFVSTKTRSGRVTVKDLPPFLANLKDFSGTFVENEIKTILDESYPNRHEEVEFETFLLAFLAVQSRKGGSKGATSFLKTSTTTFHRAISESEKASYISHINNYLREDPLWNSYIPINPATDALFDIVKDGVILCKLINAAVPGTIDERAINMKKELNPWERTENLSLCLNSAKAIGCTVVNIGTQDIAEGTPHLVLGLIFQIIKIQLLSDLNLKKTPQLVELAEDNQDVEELVGLAPEKILLKWMNFHLKKAGYEKQVTNFSSDIKDGEAYAYLLNALAPEHSTHVTLETKDPSERAKKVLEQAEKLDCKRYLSPEDIVEGSANLNLAFVAQLFQHRNGLSEESSNPPVSFAEMITEDDETSQEERCFRLWLNSLGAATYVDNVFEDVRNGWVLLEILDKVSPGSVNWKHANKPPIEILFKKVENCNQVIKIGKELRLSLVNVAGNDIVQGNKKFILGEIALMKDHSVFHTVLMRYTMLQTLNSLKSHWQGKEITETDILNWANRKVKKMGRTSQAVSFKDKNLSNGIFFLELLSAVEPRVVDWGLVTKGRTEEEKMLNATYIISVARKLGCSIFLLPEDIIEVYQKMMLILAASIMNWSLQQQSDTESWVSDDCDVSSLTEEISILSIDDGSSDAQNDEDVK